MISWRVFLSRAKVRALGNEANRDGTEQQITYCRLSKGGLRIGGGVSIFAKSRHDMLCDLHFLLKGGFNARWANGWYSVIGKG